jgi:solute carrier family 25 S-adenosylmethionine transporter 26
LLDEENIEERLQPLFYAMLRGTPRMVDSATAIKETNKDTVERQKMQAPTQSIEKDNVHGIQKIREPIAKTAPPSVVAMPSSSQQTIPIDDYIPSDHQAIRQTPVFQQLYRLIQFQRDQYLVGTEYAQWQQRERQTVSESSMSPSSRVARTDPNDKLPYDPTALGHLQIAKVAADFIPTATVREALLPLITPLPSRELYPLLQQATIQHGILGQQALLNEVTKNIVLQFLQNPQNRLTIKKSTYGFIETKYNDGTGNTSAGDHGNTKVAEPTVLANSPVTAPTNDSDNTVSAPSKSSASSSSAVSVLPPPPPPSFITSLVAGGIAGTTVDVALFPIDTLKTRLQAPGGFFRAGGFSGIYRGLGAAAVGSAPGAALFFSTYETAKARLSAHDLMGSSSDATVHMTAASMGEVAACLVRVPTEVVKAKMQTAKTHHGLVETIRMVLQERQGDFLAPLTGGLYRGFGMTLFREIPFAMIQFPLYERSKRAWADYQGTEDVHPLQAAACGSISGAVAGAVTTPLDVLKTRLMLGVDQHGKVYRNVRDVLARTLATEGPRGLLHGLQPRVMWISIGGFVFFGAYEFAKSVVQPILG